MSKKRVRLTQRGQVLRDLLVLLALVTISSVGMWLLVEVSTRPVGP